MKLNISGTSLSSKTSLNTKKELETRFTKHGDD